MGLKTTMEKMGTGIKKLASSAKDAAQKKAVAEVETIHGKLDAKWQKHDTFLQAYIVRFKLNAKKMAKFWDAEQTPKLLKLVKEQKKLTDLALKHTLGMAKLEKQMASVSKVYQKLGGT